MPPSLASRIAPYLRYMPKLTKAQQAAAGVFGHFPDADAIGRDDPRIAEYASGAKSVAVATTALDARLTPSGAPLGQAPKPAAPPPATVITVAKADDDPKPAFALHSRRQPVEGSRPNPCGWPTPSPISACRRARPHRRPGAVDITKIEPAREEVKKAEEPKPRRPSRRSRSTPAGSGCRWQAGAIARRSASTGGASRGKIPSSFRAARASW